MTPDTAILGAYVDGFEASAGQASRALRGFLTTADFVSVVVSNGHDPTHLVTFTGKHARNLADLVTEPGDAVTEIVTGTASSSARVG